MCLDNWVLHNVRITSVEALGEIKDKRAVDPLIKALFQDKFLGVRTEAAYTLGCLGDIRAIEALMKVVSNKEEDIAVRWLAADALGHIGGSQAVTYLITILEDENPDIREVAVRSLGEIGGVEVLPILEQLREKDTGETSVTDNILGRKIQVKDTAAEAIEKIKARQNN